MNYVHAFCLVFACVVLFDMVTYMVKRAPKSSTFPPACWTMGVVAVVFELGWWVF